MAKTPKQKKSVAPQSDTDRKGAMTEQTLTKTKPAEDRSDLPDLPISHNPALNFWAVFLEELDGSHRYRGGIPAIPKWTKRPYVQDRTDTHAPMTIDQATTWAQMQVKEKGRKALYAKDSRGRDKYRETREWIHIDSRTKKYYEDLDVALAKSEPYVYGVMLYCPVWDAAPGGGLERHGTYLGVNESEAASRPDYHGKPGYCPRCNHDPKMEAEAMREITALYKKAGVDLPEELTEAVRKATADGRLK